MKIKLIINNIIVILIIIRTQNEIQKVENVPQHTFTPYGNNKPANEVINCHY